MIIERLGQPPVLKDGTIVPLSPAVRTGPYLYLSGVLPFRPDGSLAIDDAAAQTHQCFANMAQVLKLAGAGIDDIVKVTAWLVRKKDFAAFNAAYVENVGDQAPARSTICAELMVPDALVEIEAIALVKSEKP